MTDVLDFIRKSIAADVANEKVVDIERYCRRLAPSRPGTKLHELQSEIIMIVATYHGGAAWGENRVHNTDHEGARPFAVSKDDKGPRSF